MKFSGMKLSFGNKRSESDQSVSKHLLRNKRSESGQSVSKQSFWNRRNESGQSMVELAITLPLVLLLICGMLEMGWLASARQVMDTMTREATRAGVVATSTAASTTAVNAAVTKAKPSYMTKTMTVTVTFSKPSSFKDGDITVTTAYDLPTLTPLTSFLAPGGTFHIVSTCTMKVG